MEDLVVDRSLRSKGVGKGIVGQLLAYAKGCGCYKVIVDCSEENVGETRVLQACTRWPLLPAPCLTKVFAPAQGFYEKCGFQRKEKCMVAYLSAVSAAGQQTEADWHRESADLSLSRLSVDRGAAKADPAAYDATTLLAAKLDDSFAVRLLSVEDYERCGQEHPPACEGRSAPFAPCSPRHRC